MLFDLPAASVVIGKGLGLISIALVLSKGKSKEDGNK